MKVSKIKSNVVSSRGNIFEIKETNIDEEFEKALHSF